MTEASKIARIIRQEGPFEKKVWAVLTLEKRVWTFQETFPNPLKAFHACCREYSSGIAGIADTSSRELGHVFIDGKWFGMTE